MYDKHLHAVNYLSLGEVKRLELRKGTQRASTLCETSHFLGVVRETNWQNII